MTAIEVRMRNGNWFE